MMAYSESSGAVPAGGFMTAGGASAMMGWLGALTSVALMGGLGLAFFAASLALFRRSMSLSA